MPRTKSPKAAKSPKKTQAAKSPAKRKSAHKPPPVRLGKNGRRWYTDFERCCVLSALKANGGNVALTAKEQGICYHTLYTWAKGLRCPEALQLSNDYDGRMADALTEIAWQACAILPPALDKAGALQLATVMEKAVAQSRILRGLPNQYVETRNTNSDAPPLDPARLNESERIELVRLIEKARGFAEPGSGDGGDPEPLVTDSPRKVPRVLT